MAAELTDLDKAFNAGVEAAIEYHERKARAADKAAQAASGIDDENYDSGWSLKLTGAMMMHRSFGNALRRLRRLTGAEMALQDLAADILNR